MNDLTPLDTSWLLICAFLVTTMQIGFCALESGLVRQKNSINVAFKNLMDFVVAGLVFWLIGYGLMFGASSANGLLGTDLFLRSHADGNAAFFVYQMVFCSVAATIVGGALAERTKLTSYLLISALVAALFYPLMGHWAWGGTLEKWRARLARRTRLCRLRWRDRRSRYRRLAGARGSHCHRPAHRSLRH